jgi:hypothetical protein
VIAALTITPTVITYRKREGGVDVESVGETRNVEALRIDDDPGFYPRWRALLLLGALVAFALLLLFAPLSLTAAYRMPYGGIGLAACAWFWAALSLAIALPALWMILSDRQYNERTRRLVIAFDGPTRLVCNGLLEAEASELAAQIAELRGDVRVANVPTTLLVRPARRGAKSATKP